MPPSNAPSLASLVTLPNIGPVLAARLDRAGISSSEALLAIGDEAAFERLRGELPADACTHTRLALAGAVRGVRWHALPAVARAHLAVQALPGGGGPVSPPAGMVRATNTSGDARIGSPARGEVWWTGPDTPQAVVILGKADDGAIRAIRVVHAVRGRAGHAVEVALGPEDGLPNGSVVRVAIAVAGRTHCTWLITFGQDALLERAGELSADRQRQLDAALRRGGLEP